MPKPPPITRRLVPDDHRLKFLPRHFGRNMMVFEQGIYTVARRLSETYTGGYWHYYDLSNSGAYMELAADGQFRLVQEGNGFDEMVSAECLSLVSNLQVFSELSWVQRENAWGDYYHRLRDYVVYHPDKALVQQVLRAID